MKRHRYLFLILLLIFMVGCTESSSPAQTAKKQANSILEYTLSNNSDGIKKLFLPSMQESEELDEQIADFLKFIDGDVISYSNPDGGIDSATVINGKTIIEELTGKVRNIKTNTGKRYMIYHYSIRVNDEYPDEVGVYYIGIVNLDTYNPESGYPESGKFSIGEFRNT